MAKRCLVADVRPSAVCVGIARLEDECRLIADAAGRTVHSLDAPHLWRDGDDLAPLPDRVRRLRELLEYREGPLENAIAAGAAVLSLLSGIKAFAENRLETHLPDIAIVLPRHLSEPALELVRSCAVRAGFKGITKSTACVAAVQAYGLDQHEEDEVHVLVATVTATIFDSEKGVFKHVHTSQRMRGCDELSGTVHEAVETVLSESRVSRDHIGHLLCHGEISSDEADAVGADVLVECLPSATLHKTLAPSQVAAHGMIKFMRHSMANPRSSSDGVWYSDVACFTIGFEVTDGLCERFFHATILSQQLRDQSHESTVASQTDPSRFGSAKGLHAGWNDLEIHLDMTELTNIIRIDATIALDGTEGIALRDQFIAYFEQFERLPTLSVEVARRQRAYTRGCTRELVAAACASLGRTFPAGAHGEVRAAQLQLMNSPVAETQLSATAQSLELVTLLDRFDEHSEFHDEEALHNAATNFLGDRLRWLHRFMRNDRCLHCTLRDVM